MKRIVLYSLVVLMLLTNICLFASAAPAAPVITMQPQSPTYTNYGVAIYTVKVDGTNLTATWYMDWQGKTYTISDIGGAIQAWEGYAGESYGARKLDDNTFAFIFEGIERELDGAYIWCVIEDGHYDVTSQKARVSVGEVGLPPEILSIPVQLTVAQGEEAELRCVAKAPDGTQLSFLWYETDTGKLEDIRAVNRGEETGDFLICDTSTVGSRNYICKITTSNGGVAYSSVVPVTVTEKASTPVIAPEVETTPVTSATQPASPETQPAAEQTEEPDATSATVAETLAQTEPTQPVSTTGQEDTAAGIPWWALVLIAIAAVGGGVGAAIIFTKKKA